jgi:hypothetical protein
MNKEENKKEIKKEKKKSKTSLSSKINKTGEDIAMLQERKHSKKQNNENLCDRHWDGA